MYREISGWKPKEPSHMWNALGLVHFGIVLTLCIDSGAFRE